MKINFSKHAELKFADLEGQVYQISRKQVDNALNMPEKIIAGEIGRLIGQRSIAETHMIRVIYEKEEDSIKVITFYPTRRRKYES